MPYDPQMFRPAPLPAWVPMGDDDQEDQTAQATGSFVDLLKKRMMGGGKSANLGGGSSYTPGGTGAVRPRTVGGGGGGGMGGGEGGGMQSL